MNYRNKAHLVGDSSQHKGHRRSLGTTGFGPVLPGLLLLTLGAPFLTAQTQINLRTQSTDVNFTLAPSTAPVKVGTTLPGTCLVGELFYDSDAPAGQNLFGCTATNTWTLEGDGGGGGGGGGIVSQKTGTGNPNGTQTCAAPSTTGRTVYFDTATLETWQCVGTNQWRKILDTDNTGPVAMSGAYAATDLSAPSTVGQGTMQFGDNGLEYFPNGGSLSRTVVPKNCGSLSTGDFVTAIAIDGSITCGTPSAVQAFDTQTAQIDSVAMGTLLGAAAAGLYRIDTYLHTTTPEGSTCSMGVTIGWTYNGGAKTLQAVTGHDLNTDESASENVTVILVDEATAITRALTDDCTRSAYTYDYSIVLEKVN